MDDGSTLLIYGAFFLVPFLYLMRKWLQGGKCQNDVRLDGKTVIITGANTGIGKETAVELAKRGARVVMACRSETKGRVAQEEVKKRSASGTVYLELLDLASLKSVRDFACRFVTKYQMLHILINNAVVICDYTKTEDGFELSLIHI